MIIDHEMKVKMMRMRCVMVSNSDERQMNVGAYLNCLIMTIINYETIVIKLKRNYFAKVMKYVNSFVTKRLHKSFSNE